MTDPEDWLLFRSEDGRVTAYLQDCGCERIRPLWGIDIHPTKTEKIDQDKQEYMVVVTGDAVSNVTKKVVEGLEGARCSTDDFCRYKNGAQKLLSVRKAARANLDGGCVRELTGLSSVPMEELNEAWKGTTKTSDHCRLGRGFGSKAERQNVAVSYDGKEAPKCPKCGAAMRLKKGSTKKEKLS